MSTSKMYKGRICCVTVKDWGVKVYLARIVDYDEDEQDNWGITKFQLIGENFVRDYDAPDITGIMRIHGADKQAMAEKLVAKNWNAKTAYAGYDELREALLEFS